MVGGTARQWFVLSALESLNPALSLGTNSAVHSPNKAVFAAKYFRFGNICLTFSRFRNHLPLRIRRFTRRASMALRDDLDDLDRTIVALLTEDGRLSASEIARKPASSAGVTRPSRATTCATPGARLSG